MGNLTEYDYLKGSLLQFNNQKEELTKKVKEYCQNKEFPLDKRWDLFIESDFGKHEGWCIDLNSINLDNFYAQKDRHQTFIVDDLIFWLSDHAYTNIDEIKEELLQMFIKSFEYDW